MMKVEQTCNGTYFSKLFCLTTRSCSERVTILKSRAIFIRKLLFTFMKINNTENGHDDNNRDRTM